MALDPTTRVLPASLDTSAVGTNNSPALMSALVVNPFTMGSASLVKNFSFQSTDPVWRSVTLIAR